MSKVKFVEVDFLSLDSSFKGEQMQFRQFSFSEFRKTFNRLGLVAPRPKPGREIGYIYQANGLTVFVWTTFLADQKVTRESDLGWVLIASGDTAQYFAHPIRRTKNFMRNLLCHAWLAKFRVLHRPICPKCGKYMEITRGEALKSRYWSCKNVEAHDNKKWTHESWDYLMQPKAMRFIKSERNARARYRKERREKGLSTDQAMLTRKKWGQNRPQNKITVTV